MKKAAKTVSLSTVILLLMIVVVFFYLRHEPIEEGIVAEGIIEPEIFDDAILMVTPK